MNLEIAVVPDFAPVTPIIRISVFLPPNNCCRVRRHFFRDFFRDLHFAVDELTRYFGVSVAHRPLERACFYPFVDNGLSLMDSLGKLSMSLLPVVETLTADLELS